MSQAVDPQLEQTPQTAVASETARSRAAGPTYIPSADIRETEDAFWLWADVPGADESSVDVSFEDGVLRIHARQAADEPTGAEPLRAEYAAGAFARSFRIDAAIDADQISASLANGVLQLRLPKTVQARPRRVPVLAA
jgi:HSP20 family molecular chaperone IbpA